MSPIFHFSQEPEANKKMGSRHRPLHACGVCILAIASIAYRKTQNLNGPLSSTWRKMIKLAEFGCPLIYAMLHEWLAILSFFDDHILVAEKMIEKIFPSSGYVFDKIDELVETVASQPQKFDDAVNNFLAIIHQVPFIEWALLNVISWLNYLISTLNHWGLENSGIKEITIDIDTNCNEQQNSASGEYVPIHSSHNNNNESFPPLSEASEAQNKGVVVAVSGHKKGTYKEALERGKEENLQKNECEEGKTEMEWQSQKIDGGQCEANEGHKMDTDNDNVSAVKYDVGRSESFKEHDRLLQLFDSGWLMNDETSYMN